MNRPIKFRAKGSGLWRYGQYVHTSKNPPYPYNRDYTDYIVSFDEFGYHHIPITDIGTLGQFTGLLDCNGKEIYEGDIILYGGLIQNEVVFRHGAFGYLIYGGEFISYAGNTNFTFNPLNRSKKHEVIGNIYDNPELLKGGEK